MSDILDMDLATVDTSFPCIKPGIYQLKFSESEIKSNEAKTWMQTFETLEPSVSDKGEQIEAGQKVFNTINLSPTGKAKAKNVIVNAAEFIQALPNSAGWSIPRILTDHQELLGQIVKANIGIQAAGPDRQGTYRKARNIIKVFIKNS